MRKTIGTILAVAFVLIGIHFGIISGLIGAAIAAYSLKHFGVVSPNSAWVSETSGVRTAKYILLAVVLILLAAMTYFSVIKQ